MRQHKDIIKEAGAPVDLAKDFGVSVHTVRSWSQRNRIPSEHWAKLVSAELASFEELAA